MDSFARLYLPGAAAVWCAVVFALVAFGAYVQLLRGDETARPFARRAYRFFALSVVLAGLVLLVLLLRRDFRIEYVFQYSGLELPWFYQLAAFWAGQKGSFLIWLVWAALLGIPLYRSIGAGEDEAPTMLVYLATALSILFILVRENPFVMLPSSPADGEGLNPLLQDNWMVIHPPIMFVGYALTAAPFSLAVGALWRRRGLRAAAESDATRAGWARHAFPWTLAAFLVLGSAILMGGYWAYKTLGWGGFWGWDPVENASLVPWLVLVVLIHGLHMETVKGRYRRINFLLAVLAFLAVLYGTFLTRSGVLADFSVHSFVDLGISGWLVGSMAFFGLTSAWLLLTRWRSIDTARNEDPIWSRGSAMVLGTIAIGASALTVAIGTSAPLITRWSSQAAQVGPSFYNRVNLPLALLVALLLAFVPALAWRSLPPAQVLRRLALPALGAVAATVVAVIAGVREPLHALWVFLATLALVANLWKTIELGRRGGMRVAGGYLAHVGVGVILVGILMSSAYDEGGKVTLVQGQSQRLDNWTLTFTRFVPAARGERESMEIEVRRDGDERPFFAYPRLFLNERSRQLMVNPHIHQLGLADLYISPLEFDPGRPAGGFVDLELRKGESAQVAETEVRFEDFDLQVEGNALAHMEAGEPVTIGARLVITRRGASGTTEPWRVLPLYRFRPSGEAESPPATVPGGGTVFLTGINATERAVQLQVRGFGAETAAEPARLAVDVTRKPLIRLVWYGLYVVLAGGFLAWRARSA